MLKAYKGIWSTVLLLFFALVYLVPLNTRLLWQPDETRYAEISREMLQRGDWVVPHLLGLRYFEKPIAGYWFNNISQMIFGDTNFAVRFGSVFCTLLSTILVFWMAMLMWRNRQTACVAALIYLSSLLVFTIGTYSVLDPMITLWMSAAMVASYYCLRVTGTKQKALSWIALGLACGMGFMTKGFLALAVPVIAVLPIVWREKRFKTLLGWGPLAILSAILLSLPWVLAIAHREPDFWNYFFWVEHIQRFAEQNAQHKAPFWYYVPVIFLGALPWMGLLPGALISGWTKRVMRPELFFLLSWTVMPLIFFSIAKGKLPTYILPCFAPLALLMADYLDQIRLSGRLKALKANGIINIIFGVLAVAALVVISGRLPLHIKPVYTAGEFPKVLIAILCFAVWALAGVISLTSLRRRWYWAAACPLVLALLVGQVIPQKVIDSKQPQVFVDANIALLKASKYVLADNVGIATGLAWTLKRSDILMYDEKGELQYGLGYPDAENHYIGANSFPAWLQNARQQGAVTVVIKQESIGADNSKLPRPDKVVEMDRLSLLFYNKLP
ncbi:undecaprenyl phosphate-alpha-4-amino-4-deoxy-L-arabinose arabinosyl transferase [Hafnia psychrotolerans]|uniref:Undecaprenyl phosphate-alpha-4-amino-4-deoxy-L-arabinose arabinosyl transferase n=1 Tax=Hafnia psychrotolerans TaxID=1477018 RepID=A0ABQ1GBT0_9GAMM|nr:undecaprenyl phosphate-alpha-4-amino-4-deoxy-L-arabinose arabinosyl transferase [Hafnia psychrotolerans]